jgi:magnesium transporter
VSADAVRDETSSGRVGAHTITVAPHETAGQLRERLRRDGRARWDLACVVDEAGRLLGTLTPSELLLLDAGDRVAERALAPRPVPAGIDQEHMASWALQNGVSSVPVVDAERRLLGVVGPLDLMDVLRREHVEDLHRLAGISRETSVAREALEAPPLRRVRHRLPWLLVGLAGSASPPT